MTPLFKRLTAILLLALVALSACVPTSSLRETAVDVEEEAVATAVIMPTVTASQEEIETETPQPVPTEEITDEEKNMTPTSETLTLKVLENTESARPSSANAQKAIQLAQKSLAKQLDMAIEDITFLNYQPQTWPDGSMGCRQGGKMYAPVEISGYIIRLQVEGNVYAFHGGMDRRPFLCQSKALKDTKPGEIIVPPTINE